MKEFLIILCLLVTTNLSGQITVKGQLIDKETNDTIGYLPIEIKGKIKGCFPNKNGFFQLDIENGDTLKISGVGFPSYYIYNISSELTTIELGQIPVIAAGFEGFVTTDKKCKYVDKTNKIFKDDLRVRCSDGSVRYKWRIINKRELYVNFSDVKTCP